MEGLIEENFIPVCSPSLAEAGSLRAEDLSQLSPGSLGEVAGAVDALAGAGENGTKRALATCTVRSQPYGHRRCRGGLGIALESTLMMQRELTDGSLVCPVRDPPEISHCYTMDRLSARPSTSQEGKNISRLATLAERDKGLHDLQSAKRTRSKPFRLFEPGVHSIGRLTKHSSGIGGSSAAELAGQ